MQTSVPQFSASSFPVAGIDSRLGKIAVAIGASTLVAISAHISLPLPFTPVPLTLSDFAVLIIGLALGPVTAFSALILYLSAGLVGLPVFTPSGPGGAAQLLGPTGGFLVSYPLVAMLAGFVVRGLGTVTTRFNACLVAGVCASALLFSFGAVWLGVLLHISAGTTFHLAVQPFLPGTAIKVVIAAAVLSNIQRFRQRA